MSHEPHGPDGMHDPDASADELALEVVDSVPSHGYRHGRIVGLGGSAGAIEAMQRFFEAMPADSGMAFVVVLHLSPEHDSMLSEILQRSTAMPVSPATDGEAVLPNHVYVIPPGRHLSLSDGNLRLTELDRQPGRHMTVDLFFRSLAETHGPQAVAVVLSGGDGDGAIGIKRIKECGGLTIAQEPEGAEHPSMPKTAIATNMVDWVLKPEEMPSRLLEYAAREQVLKIPPETGPNPAAPITPAKDSEEAALRDVLAFLRTRTGRDFSYYKRATIVRRVGRRMQINGVDSLTAYLPYLRLHPGEAAALLHDLLISVTNFFRDRHAFEALERVIPELFRGKTQSDTVRVWVPACATGEEAYSIGILLTEHARTLDAPPALQIFATDLDEHVLAEGRSGLYPEAISTDVSPERLRRFFTKEHLGYRVRRELREMVLFALHDLLKDSPFSRLDLVSCRNLLIYLNGDAQDRAFDIFNFALRRDGRLFLGTSESVQDDSHLFAPVDKKHRLYATRGAARYNLPVPSGASTLARALELRDRHEATASLASEPASAANRGALPRHKAGLPDHLSWSELHLKLLERVGPPSLIVDLNQEILHLSQGAAPFLQFAAGEPSTNLLRVVHPALRMDVRAALFRTEQTGEPGAAKDVPFVLGDREQLVDVHVSMASDLSTELMLVTFELHAVGTESPAPRLEQNEPALRHMERELEQTKGMLRDVVEQHEASTEELKASNEELQAMNEELRSATEELETSREELQSINEELTTVNQELKSNVEELGSINSDLHNLMGATAIATVFLDRELRITRFTPRAVDLFSLIPTDVGRPLADLRHRLTYPDLLQDATKVLQILVPIEREVSEQGGRAFLARLLPYRTIEDRIAGVVLTFFDITERQAAQIAMDRARQDLEVRVQERTAQLDDVNAKLRLEVKGHQRAEQDRLTLQRLLLDAQEQERSRISRELHDEVGQQIAALMFSMKELESAEPGPEMQGKLVSLRATAEQVAREIHQLAFELRPVALDELGLSGALSSYLDGWLTRTGIAIDYVSAGLDERRLPPYIETVLYRIVQEAMTNVHKHASAKSVSISIERRNDHVVAIVEDDGVGFDSIRPPAEAGPPQIGIAGMRERAALAGGELTIDARPGHGTTVRVRMPLVSN